MTQPPAGQLSAFYPPYYQGGGGGGGQLDPHLNLANDLRLVYQHTSYKERVARATRNVLDQAAFSLYQHPPPGPPHQAGGPGPGAPPGAGHQPPGMQTPGHLVSVGTQTTPTVPSEGGASEASQAVQEAGASVPASNTGKKGKKKDTKEKPGKAVAGPGEGMQARPVLAPLTIPGACPDQVGVGGGQPVPPTPSPQQGDAALFAFPPALAL